MSFLKFAMGTKVLMGDGVCGQIILEAEIAKAKKALIVTDTGLENAGIIDRFLNYIDTSKLDVTIFNEVLPDPSVKTVDKGAELAREEECDLIIAVGGGSCIDAGKGISVVAVNGGTAADYEGLNRYGKPPLPLFAVPTTAGTGSEVTFGAVLTNMNYKFILYGDSLAPKAAFLDPSLVVGIPPRILLPPAMDALTHAMESYLSKGSTLQSGTMALRAVTLIKDNLKPAVENTTDVGTITNLLYAANIAGIAFATSRLGIVHAMALPLGAFYHVPHGVANTILLPHGLEYNLGWADKRYCDLAQAMGENIAGLPEKDGASRLIEGVRKLAADAGAPSKLSAVGVTEDKIAEMARDTMKSSHIPANPRPILEKEVAELYRKAL